MDLMPSDFTAVNSTLPACAMIPKTSGWAIQLLNHLLGLPNQATSRYFQERSSTVTVILKFFSYRIVNLLIFLLFSPNFRHFSQRVRRIQSWYRFHLHDKFFSCSANLPRGLPAFIIQVSYTVRNPIFRLVDLYHVALGYEETTSLTSLSWCNTRGVNSIHHCHYTMASADSKFDDFCLQRIQFE